MNHFVSHFVFPLYMCFSHTKGGGGGGGGVVCVILSNLSRTNLLVFSGFLCCETSTSYQ